MTNSPLVTVRIASYNHAKYIEESIFSVVDQTYKNIELIVVDDGSSDNSPEIISKLATRYSFKFIQQKNIGHSATLNKILKEYTSGKYIIGTASDDKLAPDTIQKYVEYMEINPEFGMCYGNLYKMNADSVVIGEIKGTGHTGDLYRKIAIGEAFLPTPSFMWRTEIFKKIGYYDESIVSEDIYMLNKVAKNYKIGYVNTFAKYYRVHQKNSTANHFLMYENSKKISELYKNEPFYSEVLKLKTLQWFYTLSQKHKKEALRYFFPAAKKFYNRLFIAGLLNLVGLSIIPILFKSVKIFLYKKNNTIE